MPQTALPNADSLRTATEPRRLQILELVWNHEMSVNEIAAHLPVSVAAVSQHLSKLRAAGLVSVRAEGQKRFYRATKADMGALAVVLESFWTDRLAALKQLAETVERSKSTSQSPIRTPDDKDMK
jgi:DNA-binding transcriptional ArsR family regulator